MGHKSFETISRSAHTQQVPPPLSPKTPF